MLLFLNCYFLPFTIVIFLSDKPSPRLNFYYGSTLFILYCTLFVFRLFCSMCPCWLQPDKWLSSLPTWRFSSWVQPGQFQWVHSHVSVTKGQTGWAEASISSTGWHGSPPMPEWVLSKRLTQKSKKCLYMSPFIKQVSNQSAQLFLKYSKSP